MDTELEGCHHDALVTNFPRVWCGVCGPGGVEATSRHRVFNKLGHIEILNVLCTFKAIMDIGHDKTPVLIPSSDSENNQDT